MGTINPDEKIKLSERISFRIVFLLLIILSIGSSSIIIYYLISHNSFTINSRKNALNEESEIIYKSLKQNMLADEAQTAAELFRDLAKDADLNTIMLYRSDGIAAFSDNSTLNRVNSNLLSSKFMTKDVFSDKKNINSNDFKTAVDTIDNILLEKSEGSEKKIIIYKPLINQPGCSKCHGFDHLVRGVIVISSSVNDLYEKMKENLIVSLISLGIILFTLSITVIVLLYKSVTTRIKKITTALQELIKENYFSKIDIEKPDEVGKLGGLVNELTHNLRERKDSVKSISCPVIDNNKDIKKPAGGEKKTMTVFFSEIRGLKGILEKKDPDEVMRIVNSLINLHADIIKEYSGDIDVVSANMIMGIFGGSSMVIDALKAAEKIRTKIKELYPDADRPVYIGIGINTGEMISGNIVLGDNLRKTVISSPVDLAARLCSIAGKNTVILSEFSFEYVACCIEAVKQSPVLYNSGKESVDIYTFRRTI